MRSAWAVVLVLAGCGAPMAASDAGADVVAGPTIGSAPLQGSYDGTVSAMEYAPVIGVTPSGTLMARAVLTPRGAGRIDAVVTPYGPPSTNEHFACVVGYAVDPAHDVAASPSAEAVTGAAITTDAPCMVAGRACAVLSGTLSFSLHGFSGHGEVTLTALFDCGYHQTDWSIEAQGARPN